MSDRTAVTVLALAALLLLVGCTEMWRYHDAVMRAHYQHAPAPMVEAAMARRQAAIERRQILRDLAAIRAELED